MMTDRYKRLPRSGVVLGPLLGLFVIILVFAIIGFSAA